MAWFKVALTIGKSSRELKKSLAIQIFDSGSISLAVACLGFFLKDTLFEECSMKEWVDFAEDYRKYSMTLLSVKGVWNHDTKCSNLTTAR